MHVHALSVQLRELRGGGDSLSPPMFTPPPHTHTHTHIHTQLMYMCCVVSGEEGGPPWDNF